MLILVTTKIKYSFGYQEGYSLGGEEVNTKQHDRCYIRNIYILRHSPPQVLDIRLYSILEHIPLLSTPDLLPTNWFLGLQCCSHPHCIICWLPPDL